MRSHRIHTPHVTLVVVGDDPRIVEHARHLAQDDQPLVVIGTLYSDVLPFMLGNRGHTVALVADVDDPDQLAAAIVTAERRLGRVGTVIRYRSDLPSHVLGADVPAQSVA